MELKFEVLKEWSSDELEAGLVEFRLDLARLCRRYIPERRLTDVEMINAIVLDLVRASWRWDKRKSKMPRIRVSQALGYGFGQLLNRELSMVWCLTRDNLGDCTALVHRHSGGEPDIPEYVSVDPFNYVVKRETVENVEVFQDGLASVQRMISGRNA